MCAPSIRGMRNSMDDRAMVQSEIMRTIDANLRRAQVNALMVDTLYTLRDLIPDKAEWDALIDALPDMTDEAMTDWAQGEIDKRIEDKND